ncbi:Transcription factor [Pleodorina starrii]|uniref:Alpha-1,4 glucan phosphorylase n=1 Tax=Pleodorina starrii TaxID=330485 RepID=A0A9W6F1A3_9CHLO|nr:Transcription factor [Pleodorina starrii]
MAYRQLQQSNRVAGAPTASRQIAPRVATGRRALHVAAVAEAEKTAATTRGGAASVPAPVDIANKLRYLFGRNGDYTNADAYHGTAWSVREKLIDSFNKTHEHWRKEDPKFIYYLSAEFLMGRSLTNTVYNLGLQGEYADALNQMGYEMEKVADAERDAALGNGGLGRLAACFLDSMATLDLPGWGYGIRYKYGMFKQALKNGYQIEQPDIWLTSGNPWEVRRDDVKFEVGFGGRVERRKVNGKEVTVWTPSEKVIAQAYDNPIPGFDTPTTSNLRLWDAMPLTEFDLGAFNAGDYDRAMLDRERAEAISAVLYPNDSTPEGKELRLKQQYFFVCASLQDVLSRFKAVHGTAFESLPDKACFQLNDTHPTIAVAELMRLLVDVEGLDWDQAWTITTKCLNYTNHTVMPEALEKWPVKVMAKMLPRHMEIIEVINEGWTRWLAGHLGDLKSEERAKRIAAMSIIHENPWNKEEMLVNMAYLAVVGSSAVNGVAAIHSNIVKDEILNDFYQIFPSKFQNKTNGVTPRRWLAWCNPELAALITDTLGTSEWINDTEKLAGLRAYASDKSFQAKWSAVKKAKKAKLAALIKKIHGDDVNQEALFDIQIKRIHEYKRQYLNVLSIIWRYKQLKKMSPEERRKAVPRVCVIGGKAASAYDMAKRIIRLVTAVGDVINRDPDTKDLLRLYFLPDYNVSLAETIIPAAELSQHISTAGTEASGTSNMKFQMNGCLIIGTWDGANIEIAEETGVDNVFVFGVRAEEINQLRKERKNFKTDPRWDELMRDIEGGMFGDKDYFKPLVDSVNNMKVGNDWFLLANDFAAYLEAQEEVDACYKDQAEWLRRSIMYTAGSGKFSSDRTIREYAEDIWHVKPSRPSA